MKITPKQLEEDFGGVLPDFAVLTFEDSPEPPDSTPEPKADPKPAPVPASKSGARWRQLNAFVDRTIAKADLSASEVAVWLVLFRHADPEGFSSAAQSDLARRANLGIRTARNAIAALICKGLVERVERGTKGRKASVYRLKSG